MPFTEITNITILPQVFHSYKLLFSLSPFSSTFSFPPDKTCPASSSNPCLVNLSYSSKATYLAVSGDALTISCLVSSVEIPDAATGFFLLLVVSYVPRLVRSITLSLHVEYTVAEEGLVWYVSASEIFSLESTME